MKKILLLGLIVYYSSSLFGQGPGYLGKHLYVASNFSISPALIHPTVNGKTGFAWNTKLSFAGEYIIDRKSAVGLSMTSFSTGLPGDKYCSVLYQSPYSSVYEEYQRDFDYIAPMKVRGIGLSYKKFTSGNLAPIGIYSKFELIYYSYTVDADSLVAEFKDFIQGREGWEPTVLGFDDESRFKTFALNYTLGFQRVFYDRIVFNAGIQTGIVTGGFNFIMRELELVDYYSLTSENYLDRVGKFRLMGYNAINFEVGIGVLLY